MCAFIHECIIRLFFVSFFLLFYVVVCFVVFLNNVCFGESIISLTCLYI